MKSRFILVAAALLVFVGLIVSRQFSITDKSVELQPAETMTKSLLMQNAMRLQFFKILKEFQIRTLAHVPCGRAEWMDEMSLKVEKYIGVDVSKEIIESNRSHYGSQDYNFQILDMTKDLLPKVDLIFCEEALFTLSQSEVKSALLLFKKSGATYLLASNYAKLEKNSKGRKGKFRPINFEIAPYHFPKPLLSIDLNSPNGKRLCLWKLDQLL